MGLLDFLIPATKRSVSQQLETTKEAQKRFQESGDYGQYLKNILPVLNPFTKEKAKASLELGSFAVPFGKGANILSKFLAPGAAVGGLQAAAEDRDIGKGAIGGAVGAGALGGLFKLGSVATKALGQGLAGVGEKLAVKSLRPSPSQQKVFLQETGEKLGGFLKKRGLQGIDYEGIVKTIEPVQQAFDSIVGSKKLKINPSEVLSGLQKQAEKLSKSILPQDRTKSETLKTIAENFTQQFGKRGIAADALTTLRREIDKNIRDFALDPITKGPLQHTRDAIQEAIRKTAEKKGLNIGGKSLKDVGIELSKLYKLQDIAEKQQFLGGGSQPLGITSLLGAGVGGALGNLPGAAVGVGASKMINNPKFVSLLSKIASSIGEGASQAQLPNIITQLLGQGAARVGGLVAPGRPSDQYRQPDQLQNGQITPPTDIVPQEPILSPGGQWKWDSQQNDWVSNQPQGDAGALGGGLDREKIGQLMVMDLLQTGGKNISELKILGEFLSKQEKALPVEAQKQQNLAKSGMRSLEVVEEIVRQDPNVLFKNVLPGQLLTRKYDSALFRAVEALLRARSGAAVPEQEVRRYMKGIGLKPFDDPETITFKLNQLKLDFEDVLSGAQSSGGSLQDLLQLSQ